MPNSFPKVTNNPKAFWFTQAPVSGNNALGVNNVQPLQNLTNPKSVGSPSANGYTMGSANPKFTPFQPKPATPITNPPQAVQTTASPVGNPIATGFKAFGALGAILSAPSVANDFGRGLGYLANLPQIAKNYAESDRLDKLLKQKEAQAIDRARINNQPPLAPPGFQGGAASVMYGVNLRTERTDVNLANNWAYVTGPGPIKFLGIFGNDVNGYEIGVEFANGYFPTVNIGASNVFRNASTIQRLDGQTDLSYPSTNLYPPPKPANYPSPDNWVYGDVSVKVGGTGGGDPNQGLKGLGFRESEPFKPLQVSPVAPNAETLPKGSGLVSVNGLPTISSPTAQTKAPQNQVPSSFNKPQFQARPFVAGVSDPSDRFEPRDINTGKTRAEMEQDFKKSQEQFQQNAKANEIENAKRNAQQSLANFNQLSDSPNRNNLNGVSDRQNAINNYQKSIQGDPIKEQALKEALGKTTTTQNTTPNTPVNDPNSGQTIAQLLGLTALVTALKLGSDAFVNASLPKINNIEANTTPQAQQSNAKQGVCDAMQPNQCGYEGVKQATTDATNPIKDQTVANNALLQGLTAALSGLNTFLSSSIGKILNMLNNSVVDRTLAVMNLVTNIHNAAMLTRDIGETLGGAVDNVLSLANLRFTNSEGSQVPFSDFIGSNFRAFLVQVLGAENYVSLVLNWQKANNIFHSAMAVVNTTQSMLDPLSSAIEYGMENVSKIGNGLREDGVVSENSYPAMDETIRARRVNRFERLNDTLEGAENISSNLSSITGSAVSVKEDFRQLREDQKQLRDQAANFNTADEQARAELKASLPTEITPLNLTPAPEEEESP